MARKNPAGAGTIRHRKDGRWEARYTAGIDPKTGKHIRRSIFGKTQAEVRKKLTEAIRGLDTGTYQAPSQITVFSWFDTWLNTFVAPTVKPYTLVTYRGVIRNHIVPYLGNMKLQDVRGVQIQTLYNAMMKKGLSPKTIHNVAAVAHKAFSVAVKQKLIFANPCNDAELPKTTTREINPLSENEISQFLQAIERDQFQNAFALCLFAGLREGECLGLSWKNIDFNHQRITVCQQLQREKVANGHYFIAPFTKSGKPRTIAPPAICFDYLKAERLRQNEKRLAAGSAWSNADDLVFTNALGRYLAPCEFYKHFKAIAAAIGKPTARPHDLRHTAATVAVAAGSDIKSVQQLMGHATASFTLNVYAHTSEKMMQETADKMQAFYSSLASNG